MGFDGRGGAVCDRCGDLDGDAVMAEVEGAGVICWKCAEDLGLFIFDPDGLPAARRVWLRRIHHLRGSAG